MMTRSMVFAVSRAEVWIHRQYAGFNSVDLEVAINYDMESRPILADTLDASR